MTHASRKARCNRRRNTESSPRAAWIASSTTPTGDRSSDRAASMCAMANLLMVSLTSSPYRIPSPARYHTAIPLSFPSTTRNPPPPPRPPACQPSPIVHLGQHYPSQLPPPRRRSALRSSSRPSPSPPALVDSPLERSTIPPRSRLPAIFLARAILLVPGRRPAGSCFRQEDSREWGAPFETGGCILRGMRDAVTAMVVGDVVAFVAGVLFGWLLWG